MVLSRIERKVNHLKEDFKEYLLTQTFWESESAIDSLFAEPLDPSNLKDIGTLGRQVAASQLTSDLESKLTLEKLGTGCASKRSEKSSKMSLTERLHRGTQAAIRQGITH